MPETRPELKGLELYDYNQPASRMGGDFYDYLKLGEDLLLFYLSDITGHGLDAAMMSAFVKNTIGTYVKLKANDDLPDPNSILDFMYQQFTAENYPDDYFITILLGIVDLKEHRLTYSSAGMHISPFIFFDGEIKELAAGGMPISTVITREQLYFHNDSINLPSGAILFFSTDGLLEQRAGEEVYGNRFQSIIYKKKNLPLPVIGEEINRDFSLFTGGMVGDDDITYLMMKVKREEDLPRLELSINSQITAVEKAKEEFRVFIQPYMDDIDPVMMTLHELLINAVEHGNKFDQDKKILLQVEVREEYLQVSVQDQGSGFDWRDNTGMNFGDIKDQVSQRGRGLGFVLAKKATDYFYYDHNQRGSRAVFIIFR